MTARPPSIYDCACRPGDEGLQHLLENSRRHGCCALQIRPCQIRRSTHMVCSLFQQNRQTLACWECPNAPQHGHCRCLCYGLVVVIPQFMSVHWGKELLGHQNTHPCSTKRSAAGVTFGVVPREVVSPAGCDNTVSAGTTPLLTRTTISPTPKKAFCRVVAMHHFKRIQ